MVLVVGIIATVDRVRNIYFNLNNHYSYSGYSHYGREITMDLGRVEIAIRKMERTMVKYSEYGATDSDVEYVWQGLLMKAARNNLCKKQRTEGKKTRLL